MQDQKKILWQSKSLHHQRIFGPCISLLRQELDSLIRVCYLNRIEDASLKKSLIEDTINGIEWTKNGKRITDRKMVNIASEYNHWAPEVYDFGNCFTHLTNFHDYQNIDPLDDLDPYKKRIIIGYLSHYHGYSGNDLNFERIIFFLPMVADKVSNNLISYLKDLEF